MPALLQINHKLRNTIGWIARLLILGLCGWFIVSEVDDKWVFQLSFSQEQLWVILGVAVLAFANWGLEVWRWKFSLDQITTTSWGESSRQVFSGLALNWIVPFTGGDLIARLTPNQDRKQVGLLIYFNRSIMLGLTIVFGMFGIYWYSQSLFSSRAWIMIVVIIGLILLGYFGSRFFKKSIESDKGWLIKLGLLSVVRYLIFSIQFALLIWIFNLELEILLILAGVGWIFLFRSAIPSLFGNLGVREASALVFFEGYIAGASFILIPSLLIWIINTVLPSAVGLYYLMRFPVKIAQ